jgi:hypothetical protein
MKNYKNNLGKYGFCLAAPLAALFIPACLASVETLDVDSDDVDSEDVVTTEKELYISTNDVWDRTNIRVCWEESAGTGIEHRWVRDAVKRTWEAHTQLQFTGWGRCASSEDIRISVVDDWPHTKGLGKKLRNKRNGMVLNFTFNEWSPVCRSQLERCIRGIAIHEFGHALGFSHEHNRPDTPTTCTSEPQGTNGDQTYGPWDAMSVMNYCSPTWGPLSLSANDSSGARSVYGTRPVLSSVWSSNSSVSTQLSPGQRLESGQAIFSPSGRYRLELQGDGNLVLSHAFLGRPTAIWASNTWGRTATHATLQHDGNFVLYNGSQPLWASNTAGRSGAHLDLQNDGNLVLYQPVTAWQTNTVLSAATGEARFPVGTVLSPGASNARWLSSPNGQFHFSMQRDGNLVLYNAVWRALWNSGTWGRGGTDLIHQRDGNLVMYGPTGPVWASGTARGVEEGGRVDSTLSIGNNGNVTIRQRRPVWDTGTWQTSLLHGARIVPGGTVLNEGQIWMTPSGRFSARLSTGALVIRQGGSTLWSTPTEGSSAKRCEFQSDGNLRLLTEGGSVVWQSGARGNGTFLALLDNGDLTVFQPARHALWNTGTAGQAGPGAEITFSPGTRMASGERITFGNGRFHFSMQQDGNLVLYNSSWRPMWSSGTWGNPGAHAVMQQDGNFVVYSSANVPLWSTNTYGYTGAYLALQADGNVVVYGEAAVGQ